MQYANLEDLQKKYREIVESGEIPRILDESNEKVEKICKKKVQEVFEKIGVGR